MPYTIAGYDSAGVQQTSTMTDSGAVSGDSPLLTDYLAEHPLEPFAGDTPTDAELEAVRQAASCVLTYVTVSLAPEPEPEPAPQTSPYPTV